MFFTESSTKVEIEKVKQEMRNLRRLHDYIKVLQAYDRRLQIFSDRTDQGRANRKAVLEALASRFPDPLQALINGYRSAFNESKTVSCPGDLN